jgi:hypothetical protein
MNMKESDLENELRSLRPAQPSAVLEEKIAAELHASPPLALTPSRAGQRQAAGVLAAPRTNLWLALLHRLGWAAAGATAAVLVLTARGPLTNPENSTPPASLALREDPDASIEEFIDAADEGVVLDADATPQRQMRLTYLERHTWTNPATGTVIEFEIPREDTVWMPLAMQ